MSWFSTIVTAIITAAIGTAAGLFVANQAVRWYRISSFEGGAGYWVLSMGLIAVVVGLIVGVVVSRVIAATSAPSFMKGLGSSVFAMLTLVAIVGVVARLMADIPPTIDGEELMLVVEARWPKTQVESPANAPGIAYLQLGSSTSSHVQRVSRRGALWKEDAKQVDGQWIVPGAVGIFTERGTPTLDIALNENERKGFILRLSSRPSKKDFEWTDWYPKDGKKGPTNTTGVTYRYRVQKTSVPIRTEHIGPFEVDAVASTYMNQPADGTNTLDPNAEFHIRYNGKPVKYAPEPAGSAGANTSVRMIAELHGPRTTLLVLVNPEMSTEHCSLLIDDNGTLREERVATCNNVIDVEDLSPDKLGKDRANSQNLPRGRVDRHTYASSTMLLFTETVLNVAQMKLHHFDADTSATNISSLPSLGVSPDGGSFVRHMTDYQRATNSSLPVLVVTDFVNNTSTMLPIDRARMRYSELSDFTPAWVLHHFKWQHDASGKDVLVVRTDFTPLPYSGKLGEDTIGNQTYTVPEGGQTVRMAIMNMLVTDFKAQRDSVSEDEYSYPVHIDGRKLFVSSNSKDYVTVTFADEGPKTDLVARIANTFNAVLATGKYDSLFGHLE